MKQTWITVLVSTIRTILYLTSFLRKLKISNFLVKILIGRKNGTFRHLWVIQNNWPVILSRKVSVSTDISLGPTTWVSSHRKVHNTWQVWSLFFKSMKIFVKGKIAVEGSGPISVVLILKKKKKTDCTYKKEFFFLYISLSTFCDLNLFYDLKSTLYWFQKKI